MSKTIGRLCKPQNLLPRKPLITVYKSFLKPRLDYGDVIYYHNPYNASLYCQFNSIQYNDALAKTNALHGTSQEKLYQDLEFESLQQRCW